MSDPSEAHNILLNRLADEFALRVRTGERPRLDEYCDRHPELANDIRFLFPAMLELERARADAGPELAVAMSDAARITNLGDFQLLREVGRGGMGVVYEAEQVSLGRRVALKLLPATVFRDPVKRRRFEREAKAAARLHHTNIVPVHGFGEHAGTPYYVMQFIPGLGLDAVIDELAQSPGRGAEPGSPAGRRSDLSIALARSLLGEDATDAGDRSHPVNAALTATAANGNTPGPGPHPSTDRGSSVSLSASGVYLPGQPPSETGGRATKQATYWESVARIGVQVGGALAYAHKLGVLHRDIKPGNLLLDLNGTVWVTDFGLAKADDSADLTNTGDLLGTLRYMPPEAFEGKSDVRSDVYALGLTLYELVALRPAYQERDRNKLIKQVTTGDPPRLRKLREDAPRDLVTVIEKAIDRDPARRYQTAGALADDLQRFLNDQPIQARRQTQLERCVRWARHNPGIAVLGSTLAAVLVIVTVASLLVAGHFDRLRGNEAQAAESERDARREADLAREAEASQRRHAVEERKRADVTLADMYTSRGLLAAERDAPAEAALWFSAAADQSATAENSGREEDSQLRARNWLRQATVPVAVLALPVGANQLDFQPRGDLVVVRFGPGQLMLWSWRDGTRLPWTESLDGVRAAQFAPDGASIALALESGEAQIRRVADGEVLSTLRDTGPITTVRYSPDGKLLAVGGDGVRFWEVDRQEFAAPGWLHPQPVTGLLFSRAGDRLITTSADHRARVFAVADLKAGIRPLFAPVAHVLPSPPALIDDDRVLVTVTADGELTRWSMATGQPAGMPTRTRPRLLEEVAASPDGKWLAASGVDGPEIQSANAALPLVHLGHTNRVRKSVFSPDGTMLLTASWDSTARLWSLPTGQPIGHPLTHMAFVDLCAWSHDARYVATAQTGGLVRVWQRPVDGLVTAKENGWGECPRVSFDGRLAVPGLWHESPNGGPNVTGRRVRVVTTASGQPAGPDISLPGPVADACVCADNRAVAAAWATGDKGYLGVWEVATAKARFEPIPLPGPPLSVAARRGSHQLAVLCSTGDVLVLDDQTGEGALRLRHDGWPDSPAGRSTRVQYTPDGTALISLTAQSIDVCDAGSGERRFAALRPSVEGSWFHSLSVSADSRLLATTALGKNHVQVWDLATGRPVSEPLPHPGDFWGLFAVRFSPDGRHLLTAHQDGQARYWDWQAGKLACPAMPFDNDVMDAAITPDGRFALTAVRKRPEMQVWELATGRRVAPSVRFAPQDGGSALRVAVTPDGRRALVTYWGSGTTIGNFRLAVVDLEALLAPSRLPTNDLRLLAELTTGRRIELGDLSGLTVDQWLQRWDQLRERNPDLARSDVVRPRSAGK